jgi:hypothetical protein
MLQFIIFLGAVSEVLKVFIYNAVWVRMPYSLVHVYECSGGSFWVYIHRQQKMEAVCPVCNLSSHQSGYMAP